MSTQTIAGYSITLEDGKWYIASRPFINVGRTVFPVSIKDEDGQVVAVIEGLSYDEANDLINAFNNGKMSFDGRVW